MNSPVPEQRAQIVYLSHGGGPLPILGDPSHASMIRFMHELPLQLRRPDAIVVFSAHWEETIATVQAAARPTMLYDYVGFPKESYALTYPAPGDPALAGTISETLKRAGIAAQLDHARGFDHGLFIPLKMLVPNADIPTFQISLLRNLDPGAHIQLGRALRELSSENILWVGSGASFHNLSQFVMQPPPVPDPKNEAFQDWLINVCVHTESQAKREKLLENWEQAPFARYCHPREEHLLPLHICMGMVDTTAKLVFNDDILGQRSVSFLWP